MNENKCHWKWPPIKGSRNSKNRALKSGHDVNMKSKRKGHSYHLERTRREKHNMSVLGVSCEQVYLHGAELIDGKI